MSVIKTISLTEYLRTLFGHRRLVVEKLNQIIQQGERIMSQFDDLVLLAQSLKDSVDAETTAIDAENANIDKAIAFLQAGTPDISGALALLQDAKTNIDASTTKVSDEADKLAAVLPPAAQLDNPDAGRENPGNQFMKHTKIPTDARLTLDKNHIYRLGSQIIPGVTNIINAVIPRWEVDPWYMKRGSQLHRAIELLAKDDLDESSVDESYRGKLEAFKKFRAECGLTILETEIPLHSPRYRYAGKIDARAVKFNLMTTLDWKSSYAPQTIIQLAAYWNLEVENGLNPNDAAAVELKDDGNYKLHWVTKRELQLGFQQFLACLTIYGFIQKHNLNQKEK